MAEESQKRHKGTFSDTSPVDRISDLPESLISYILSSLTTKEAVATSILSRSWRFRWTKVTSFLFLAADLGSLNQIRGDDAVQTTDFVDSVNMVLLNHSGESIDKFLLRWVSPKFRPQCLYTWANIAIARNVRVIDIHTMVTEHPWRYDCEFHLPSSLYTSGTLEVLKLAGPFRVKPPNVVCLPKLVQMDLRKIIYESDEAIPKLITGCLVLRDLTIIRLSERDNLVVCSISSPVLKYLFIRFHDESVGRFHDESVGAEGAGGDMKLKIDAPALIELTVLDYMSSQISIRRPLTSVKTVVFSASRLAPNVIAGLMQTFSSVKCLKLHSYSMMEMERATLPVKVSFKRLAKLVIGDPQWSSLMDFLDGCSILEELVIWCHKSGGDSWRSPDRVPRCLSSSLRHIKISKFDGLEKEVAMLKFFLDHCLALERVDICCDWKETNVEVKRFGILNELCKLPGASPACKISCITSLTFLTCMGDR